MRACQDLMNWIAIAAPHKGQEIADGLNEIIGQPQSTVAKSILSTLDSFAVVDQVCSPTPNVVVSPRRCYTQDRPSAPSPKSSQRLRGRLQEPRPFLHCFPAHRCRFLRSNIIDWLRHFPALPANSSAPTNMDDSTSHPLEYPISWDKSMLARHDAVYRQATLVGSR